MAHVKPTLPYTPPSWQYQGTELQTPRGIADARLAAFALPSRNGRWLHYPDGRVEAFPTPAPTENRNHG